MRNKVTWAVAVVVAAAVGVVVVPGPASAVPGTASTAVNDDPAMAALAEAKATGKPVTVTARTTATDELVANPSGTFTLTRYPVPVRARVDGQWRPLDATLRVNADGTISPAVSSAPLVLSGGGSGPLATMRSGRSTLALTLPMALPAPTLSGSTATYRSVLPGVDLQVTADVYGGFVHTFVVHDVQAARNPALSSLRVQVDAKEVTLAATEDGGLTARDRLGITRFFAEPARMWDSSRPAFGRAVGGDPAPETQIAMRTGQPQVSTAQAPGVAARTAPIAVAVAEDSIVLTPDASLLTDPSTVFPVFIDPQWHVSGPVRSGHASVAKDFPNDNKWLSTADPVADFMQVGYADDGSWDGWRARAMVNFDLDLGKLSGATIHNATLGSTFVYSGSCTPSDIRVFAPATTLTSSNATWNYWFGSSPVPLGSAVATQSFAAGYSSSCPAAAKTFNVTSAVTAAVAQGKSRQTFVFMPGSPETINVSYKEFSISQTWMSVEYNRTPPAPTNLTTSPATSCTGTVGTIGDSGITLQAQVSDPDGTANGVEFQIWKSSTPGTLLKSTDPASYTVPSGQVAHLAVTRTELANAAGGAITEFSWRVRVKDPADAYSPWSTTCKFNYDPTRPGAPQLQTPLPAFTMGQPTAISVTKPASGPTPAKYLYQLNDEAPVIVNANGSGNATITITPRRVTNVLAVYSVSAGGNISEIAARPVFNAAPPAQAPPAGDLTGDGRPDLISAGATNGLSPGIWLSTGLAGGNVNPVGTNIGINGNGVATPARPENFTGAQVITGRFTGRTVLDVAVYYPNATTDAAAGTGVVIGGNGDASALMPTAGNQFTFNDEDLLDVDEWGVPIPDSHPKQIVAIDKDLTGLFEDNATDLITIAGTSGNYHLNYLAFVDNPTNLQALIPITATPPVASTTWDQWRLATTVIGSTVHMFLWRPANGALYLWSDLDMSTGDLTYVQRVLASSGWNTGSNLTLQAADLNGDGTPDLWTTGTNATVTVNTTSNLSGGTGTITKIAEFPITDATHLWTLGDMPSGAGDGTPIGTAADLVPTGVTAKPLTGNGAVWSTDELFSPSAKFDGVNDSLATSSGAPVATNADLTVSAWVKPTALGGTVLSQSGTVTAAYKLWAEDSDGSWRFAMSQSNSSSPTWDTVAAPAGSVQLNVWTKLTASYTQSTGTMRLYINDVPVASGSHTQTWNATGEFRVGNHRTGSSSFGGYFTGHIAHVQLWNKAAYVSGDTPALSTTDLAAHPATPPSTAVVGRPARVTVTPPGAMTVRGYYFGVGTTNPTASIWVPANSDGTATIPVVPVASGSQLNRLVVQAVDQNGRRSPVPPWGYNLLFAANPGSSLSPVVGDLHNDGRGDAVHPIAVSGTVSVWGQTSTTSGVTNPTVLAANIAQTSVDTTVTGDFNGDGRADLAILHDQGPGHTTLLVGRGQANGFATPTQVWSAGPGAWDWNRSKLTAGDYNGDGKDDLAITYNYTGTYKVWVFKSTSTVGGTISFDSPGVWWNQPPASADWERMNVFAGDFDGDGDDDLGFLYNYDNCTTKLWVHKSTGSAFDWAGMYWDSGVGAWCWDRIIPVVGDFTGDGRDDLGAFYRYNNCETKLWVKPATASGFGSWYVVFESGAGSWCGDLVRPAASDFNGDGKVDISVHYISGTNQAKLYRFVSTSTSSTPSFAAPALTYDGLVTWP